MRANWVSLLESAAIGFSSVRKVRVQAAYQASPHPLHASSLRGYLPQVHMAPAIDYLVVPLVTLCDQSVPVESDA